MCCLYLKGDRMMMMNSLFDKIIQEKKKIPLFAGKDERLIFRNV